MHESGVIRKLLETAAAAAAEEGGSLRGVHVRLGALAGGTSEHLREHFEMECARLSMPDVAIVITEEPVHPGGVEITGIDVSR